MGVQLRVEDIRGNLQTRWTKLENGTYDALLLAQAGVQRLGWHDRIAEVRRDTVCASLYVLFCVRVGGIDVQFPNAEENVRGGNCICLASIFTVYAVLTFFFRGVCRLEARSYPAPCSRMPSVKPPWASYVVTAMRAPWTYCVRSTIASPIGAAPPNGPCCGSSKAGAKFRSPPALCGRSRPLR